MPAGDSAVGSRLRRGRRGCWQSPTPTRVSWQPAADAALHQPQRYDDRDPPPSTPGRRRRGTAAIRSTRWQRLQAGPGRSVLIATSAGPPTAGFQTPSAMHHSRPTSSAPSTRTTRGCGRPFTAGAQRGRRGTSGRKTPGGWSSSWTRPPSFPEALPVGGTRTLGPRPALRATPPSGRGAGDSRERHRAAGRVVCASHSHLNGRCRVKPAKVMRKRDTLLRPLRRT